MRELGGRRGRRPVLAHAVAGRLTADIAAMHWGRLPGRAILADRYSVSPATISKAARILRDRGILRYRQGAPMTVVAAMQPAASVQAGAARTNAVDRTVTFVRGRISDGDHRAGDPLPKVGHLAAALHTSPNCVIAAYRRLAALDLAHREGRRWVAGPSTPMRGGVSAAVTARPVVVLVTRHRHSWFGLLRSERTERFCQAFIGEAERYGSQIVTTLVVAGSGMYEGRFVAGLEGTQRLILDLDGRYVGALIAATRDEVPDFGAWCTALGRGGRPVVWFDRHDEGCRGVPGAEQVTRCHFSERAAVAAAVGFLTDLGHRVAGYADFQGQGWSLQRRRLLKVIAGRASPSLAVADHLRGDLCWKHGDAGLLVGFLAELQERCPVNLRETMAVLREESDRNPRSVEDLLRATPAGWAYGLLAARGGQRTRGTGRIGWTTDEANVAACTPMMMSFMGDPGVTALIAPSDAVAQYLYLWLTVAGVAVPGEISLLSFDNYPEHQLLPVTTVEFGFGYLGYSAFHALLGDIPLRRDRQGNVAARPTVVERGSAGVPGTRLAQSRRRWVHLSAAADRPASFPPANAH